MLTKPDLAPSPQRQTWQPLDRLVVGITLVVLVFLSLLLGLGDHSSPRVRRFNWQHQAVGKTDTVLVLTFNRPMSEASVAENLRFTPPLPGRPRWLGRRLVYTLTAPVQYGQTYQVSLRDGEDQQGNRLREPFENTFTTRDRQYLLLEAAGERAGQLHLVNETQGEDRWLTPPELTVTEFQPGSDGDTVYFFATDSTIQQQELYSLSLQTGRSQRLLANTPLQNFRLQVSPHGDLVVVERLSREALGTTELWSRGEGARIFRPLVVEGETGGDFVITPDNGSLIMAQGQGLSILPIREDGSVPDFLPQFGQVLAMKGDGTAAAVVRFNSDYTRTLSILTSAGQTLELINTQGSISEGRFSPVGSRFYAVVGDLDPETFSELPKIMEFDWETGEQQVLAIAPPPATIDFDLAPDELSILYSVHHLDTDQYDTWYRRRTDPEPQPLAIASSAVAWIP